MKSDIEVIALYEREDETPMWIEALCGFGLFCVLACVIWLGFALQAAQ